MVIRQLFLDQARGCFRRFREWAQLTRASVEYIGPQPIAGEVCMVQDVEELSPELQHPTLSQEAELCLLDERKVPIPLRRPAQDIASGCAKLSDEVRSRTVLRIGGRQEEASRLVRALRYGWQREHGRIKPLVGIAGDDRVGIVDDRLVCAGIAAGSRLAWLRGARIGRQQCRRIDIDAVALLGLGNSGIRAIGIANRREWLAALDAHDAAHVPAVQRLGHKAIPCHAVREVIQRVKFPVVGDIKAGRALVYLRIQRINTQQTA